MSEDLETSLSQIVAGDDTALEILTAMNLDSLERSGLDLKTYLFVRLAALVAMDAPPTSYLANLTTAHDVVVTLEDVEKLLVAIAPLVGLARVQSAASNVLRAFQAAGVEDVESTKRSRESAAGRTGGTSRRR